MIRTPRTPPDAHSARPPTRRSLIRKPLRIVGRDAEWGRLTEFAAGSGARLGLVSGRRRQGKTLLLEALTRATGGLYVGATRATEAESLRLIDDELAQYTDRPAPATASWDATVLRLVDVAGRSGRPVVIDDLAHLTRVSPHLPAMLRRELDQADGDPAVVLCAPTPAGLPGPLRARVDLDLVVTPLGLRATARLWDVDDPHLAVALHAVVGGTTAYRRFAGGDVPVGPADFDGWVQRTVLEPTNPLFGEARYLTDSAEVRDPALYGSLLAAVPAGNGSRGAIADYLGRRAADIGHHLNVLEDCGLLRREPDVFRAGRTTYHVAEPLVAFHHVVMRPRWGLLESGRAADVWKDAAPRFAEQVLAPHFAQLCREHAAASAGRAGQVGAGIVTDGRRDQFAIDVAVFAPAVPAEPPRILGLGLASWDEVLRPAHVERLRRARDLLGARGYDIRDARLLCYGGAGFAPGVTGVTTRTPADLLDGCG
ncbi:MAG: AAA family ATPase [Pseudonocardia sp.]